MHYHPLAAALSSLIAAAVAAPVWADTGDDSEPLPDPVTLPNVVVIAIAPTAPLTFVTDPKAPRQPVPASDGADYLKTIPGFTAIRNGGTNGDPVLRGMFGSRLNLLANDGAMHSACPGRMDNPMSYVAPETFDRLTVVKGPQTVLWGPGASAGTVRFERDQEYFTQPGARISASVLGGSGARNDQVLDAAAGTPLGYARIATNRSESGDYADGSGRRVHSGWNKWNADAAFGWTPDADTALELTAGIGDGEARYAGRSMDGTRFRRDSLGLRFSRTGFDGALDTVKANVFDTRVDHVMDNYSLRTPNPMSSMPMPMGSNVGRHAMGGRVALGWKWGEYLDLQAGLDHQRNEHRRRSAPGVDAYKAQPWTEDARFESSGVFAELTTHVDAQRRVVSGLRVDRAEVTDQRMNTGGKMPMPNPTAGQTRDERLHAGFVRYEQELVDVPLTWYAGLGRTERLPDYWELFSAGRGPAGSANAFAGIVTEKTTQLDLGLHYRSKRFDSWASFYAGRIDDYILFRYGSGTTQAVNIGADIRGGEMGVGFRPARDWKIDGTLAYAWGQQRDPSRPLPQMPPLEARLSLAYAAQGWSAGALLRGVTAQERVSTGEGNVVGRDLGPSAGFGVFSVNGGYRFTEHLQLTAGIDNIFDRDYQEHLNLAGNSAFGYPADPVRISEPGRTLWLKLNLKY